ncbi:hypothetical protein [Burkholderia stabilis]|uniref:hypothetical protein n=1 Tax=Burkholderia stabilis TaxID=95485 RepID=UPI001F4AAB71|nr:hypothetical protein [Burkholderia stabilis]
MPNPWQRAEIGRAAYAAGSAIAVRNARLALAKRIGAVCVGAANTESIVTRGRTTTAADFVTNGDLSGQQIDAGREPYLLVADFYNPGHFNTVSVYDNYLGQEKRTGMCVLVVYQGDVLVRPDTLIYWK